VRKNLSDPERRLVRTVIRCAFVALCFALAVRIVAAQQDAGCAVYGVVKANGVPLPGVAVVAIETESKAARATSSGPDGGYRITLAAPGHYELTLQMAGFAPVVREVDPRAVACPYKLDIAMMLASRAPAPAAPPTAGAPPAAQAPATAQAGARGVAPRGQVAAQGQRAGAPGSAGSAQRGVPGAASSRQAASGAGQRAAGDVNVIAETGGEQVDTAAKMLLPPGFSIEAPTEALTAVGNAGQMNDMFLFGDGRGGRGGMDGVGGMPGDATGGQPGQEGAGGRGGGRGGAGGGGGRGGGAGSGMLGRALAAGGGGPGGFGPGGLGGGMRNANRVRMTANYNLGGSMLDAAPYSLTGQPVQKPRFLSQRFGASGGGPLNIPGLLDGTKTSFVVTYTGNHSTNGYSSYSTVPTLAERGGDLSAFSTQIFDPLTGQPFAGNQIPASRISPAAAALLNLFPQPTLPGTTQNFYYATNTATSQDDINLRFTRNFGDTVQRARGAIVRAVLGGGRGGGRGGIPGGMQNLSIGIHYHRSTGASANPFPALGGTSEAHAWDVPVNYSFTKWGFVNMVHARYNRSESQTFGNFAFSQNLAGDAGIGGVSPDPFDWGAPGVSLSSFSSLRDVNPSRRLAQTIDVGDQLMRLKGRHVIRFGGDYRAYLTNSRTDSNARGTFVFTGLYSADPAGGRVVAGSGLDFADFLLGMPQQATVQYGPGTERFRGRSWDLFLQDDWRMNSKVTLNLGLRYEFVSPFWEADGRLVTLDANPDFTAAVPVQAGQLGPFSGQLPSTLVRPDYNDLAPRIGVAWRATDKTVVRGGYGINYNAGIYNAIAQQLAAQPPFAVAATSLGTMLAPLSFSNALLLVNPTATTNNFGIDPNYRLGYVQIWNVDVQRTLGRTAVFGLGYTGTRGANLDLQRAPNRGPTGLRIADVQPFIWETSQARSTMHAFSVRLQKRLTKGFSGGVNYTYSRAFDNASTIGGGGAVVAQNDQDLEAEWGPSSFSQPHRFAGTFTYELPFGPNKRWLNTDSAAGNILGGWQLAGNLSIASGSVFTPRVTGAIADVARGVNGTLRADYTGAPIYLGNPTIGEWFDTAAFVVPPAGRFGDAGRNSIRGPGSANLDMSMSKDIRFGAATGARGMNIRVRAGNVLNLAQFSAIDTVVNSPTFGRVVGVRPMRSVQIITRFRF
jgi:hypothetical protein